MNILIFLIFIIGSFSQEIWNCTREEAAKQFKGKKIINPFPFYDIDPYTNQTKESEQVINNTLANKEIVCAIKYIDEQKVRYEIKNFINKDSAIQNGFIVTHQGICGSCSTLQDLSVYLALNLTKPVRWCGIKGVLSEEINMKCLQNLGFTDPCVEIWFYNTRNTKKLCSRPCIWALLTNQPFVINGQLNSCLQCDEDQSGPVFKYYSGRSRRDSGIKSEIDRPGDQMYNMSQCYY